MQGDQQPADDVRSQVQNLVQPLPQNRKWDHARLTSPVFFQGEGAQQHAVQDVDVFNPGHLGEDFQAMDEKVADPK